MGEPAFFLGFDFFAPEKKWFWLAEEACELSGAEPDRTGRDLTGLDLTWLEESAGVCEQKEKTTPHSPRVRMNNSCASLPKTQNVGEKQTTFVVCFTWF